MDSAYCQLYVYGSLAKLTKVLGTGVPPSPTELTEVPGMGMEVLQNSQNSPVGIGMLYPYPRHCGTAELTEVSVRVRMSRIFAENLVGLRRLGYLRRIWLGYTAFCGSRKLRKK